MSRLVPNSLVAGSRDRVLYMDPWIHGYPEATFLEILGEVNDDEGIVF